MCTVLDIDMKEFTSPLFIENNLRQYNIST